MLSPTFFARGIASYARAPAALSLFAASVDGSVAPHAVAVVAWLWFLAIAAIVIRHVYRGKNNIHNLLDLDYSTDYSTDYTSASTSTSTSTVVATLPDDSTTDVIADVQFAEVTMSSPSGDRQVLAPLSGGAPLTINQVAVGQGGTMHGTSGMSSSGNRKMTPLRHLQMMEVNHPSLQKKMSTSDYLLKCLEQRKLNKSIQQSTDSSQPSNVVVSTSDSECSDHITCPITPPKPYKNIQLPSAPRKPATVSPFDTDDLEESQEAQDVAVVSQGIAVYFVMAYMQLRALAVYVYCCIIVMQMTSKIGNAFGIIYASVYNFISNVARYLRSFATKSRDISHASFMYMQTLALLLWNRLVPIVGMVRGWIVATVALCYSCVWSIAVVLATVGWVVIVGAICYLSTPAIFAALITLVSEPTSWAVVGLYLYYYSASAIHGWFAKGVYLICNLVSSLVALSSYLVGAVLLALATVGWIAFVGVMCCYVTTALYATCGLVADPFSWMIVAGICYYIISTIYDWIYCATWSLFTDDYQVPCLENWTCDPQHLSGKSKFIELQLVNNGWEMSHRNADECYTENVQDRVLRFKSNETFTIPNRGDIPRESLNLTLDEDTDRNYAEQRQIHQFLRDFEYERSRRLFPRHILDILDRMEKWCDPDEMNNFVREIELLDDEDDVVDEQEEVDDEAHEPQPVDSYFALAYTRLRAILMYVYLCIANMTYMVGSGFGCVYAYVCSWFASVVRFCSNVDVALCLHSIASKSRDMSHALFMHAQWMALLLWRNSLAPTLGMIYHWIARAVALFVWSIAVVLATVGWVVFVGAICYLSTPAIFAALITLVSEPTGWAVAGLYLCYYFASAIHGWFTTGVYRCYSLISSSVALCFVPVRAVLLVLATAVWVGFVGIACCYVSRTLYAACNGLVLVEPFSWMIVAGICYYIISTIYDWTYYAIWTVVNKYASCTQFIAKAFRSVTASLFSFLKSIGRLARVARTLFVSFKAFIRGRVPLYPRAMKNNSKSREMEGVPSGASVSAVKSEVVTNPSPKPQTRRVRFTASFQYQEICNRKDLKTAEKRLTRLRKKLPSNCCEDIKSLWHKCFAFRLLADIDLLEDMLDPPQNLRRSSRIRQTPV